MTTSQASTMTMVAGVGVLCWIGALLMLMTHQQGWFCVACKAKQ